MRHETSAIHCQTPTTGSGTRGKERMKMKLTAPRDYHLCFPHAIIQQNLTLKTTTLFGKLELRNANWCDQKKKKSKLRKVHQKNFLHNLDKNDGHSSLHEIKKKIFRFSKTRARRDKENNKRLEESRGGGSRGGGESNETKVDIK